MRFATRPSTPSLAAAFSGTARPFKASRANHLCSSQVFAVNLFFPFVHRPEALAALLRPHFPDLARMLPVEDDLYVSFEWIGDYNYLGELPKLGSDRHRGAGNTSIDAAVIYETTDGRRVMLLIETKY